MKHKDGIECYLRPRGAHHKGRKFREIPQASESDDDLRMCSAILKTKDRFGVAFGWSPTFELHSASALQVMVAVRTPSGRRSLAEWVISKARVYSADSIDDPRRHLAFGGWLTGPGLEQCAATSPHYSIDPSPGELLVSVHRGHIEWQDGLDRDHSLPPDSSRPSRPGLFVPLPGGLGYAYIFRFVLQTKAIYRRTIKRYKLPLPEAISDEEPGYAVDLDYRARKSTQLAMQARLREEGEATSAICEDANVNNDPEGPAPQQSGSPDSASYTAPICNCPKKHRARSSQPEVARPLQQAQERESDSERVAPLNLSPEASVSPSQDAGQSQGTAQSVAEAQETTAKQCISCKKFKRPPAGKKITYRKARGRYMCVPRNAHDEAGPVDTVMRRTVSEVHAPTRRTPEPDLPLADGTDEDSASFAATSDTSSEQEISQSETSQSVSEESTAEPPNPSTSVIAKSHQAEGAETSLDGPSITATNSITVESTEATNQPTSNKRSAEPSNEQPPAKRPRIEDSITIDNENQTVSIKTEPEADPDVQFVVSQELPKTRREKRLEEEIARKQRQLRKIELEEEMEELQRQLAEEQRRKQSATPLMKVKQEIIELD